MTENLSISELKIKIKSWEKNFYEKHKIKPTKADIEKSDKSIKDLYHHYFKIKQGSVKSHNTFPDKTWSSSLNKNSQVAKDDGKPLAENKLYSCLSNNLKNHSGLLTPKRLSLKKKYNTTNNDKSEDDKSSEVKSLGNGTDDADGSSLAAHKSQEPNIQTEKLTNENSDFDGASYSRKDDLKSNFRIKNNVNATKLILKNTNKTRKVDADWLKRCDVDASLDKVTVNNADDRLNEPLPQNEDVFKNEDQIQEEFVCEVSHSSAVLPTENNQSEPIPKMCEIVGEDVATKPRKRKASVTTGAAKKRADVDGCHGDASHAQKKLSSGQSENFVRINLKRKRFARGYQSSANKFKRWKDYKSGRLTSAKLPMSACFKCGDLGHLAKLCPNKSSNEVNKEATEDQKDDSPFLTIDEAAKLAEGIKPTASSTTVKITATKPLSGSTKEVDESIVTETDVSVKSKCCAQPLFAELCEPPDQVKDALKLMGYSTFRPGQQEAIMRILSGKSTLVVLSTGSGKSLCYQLPAYLYAKHHNYITIVVSPLVSLMEDQISGLPSCLRGMCYHTNQTTTQRAKVLQAVADAKCDVLLVSPEAIVGGGGNGAFLPAKLPPIAFACIDEVHCVSEWSHNFRPSYLRLCKVLHERYNVKCVLGLTATATLTTIHSICHHLNVDMSNALVKGSTIPDNLIISVSRDCNKDQALLSLLKDDRFGGCQSIIIYCTRRQLTEQVATLLRTSLQSTHSNNTKSTKRGRPLSCIAEAYHAGLSASSRRSIQNLFMSGELRIVVATVAFGMGLDKCDVRAVIHYNMPSSFESYVQEIGRAGRDGLPAHCHLFLDPQGNDMNELKRHIYANSTDRHCIRKLLKRILSNNQCKCNHNTCTKHPLAIPIHQTVMDLDLNEQTISTLLCYLELHPKQWIQVLNPVYATCHMNVYAGPSRLKLIAKQNAIVAAAIAIQIQKDQFDAKASTLTFNVVEVAAKMNWQSGSVKRHLKDLEWQNGRRSGIIVEFSDLAFHVNSPGQLSDDDQDEILDFVYNRLQMHEQSELYQLQQVFEALSSMSHANYWACSQKANMERSNQLKTFLCNYFNTEATDAKGRINKLLFGHEHQVDHQQQQQEISKEMEERIVSDIRDLIFTHTDHSFSGRAIARILQGIDSPCYPAQVWGRVRKFWRAYLHLDFNLILKLANSLLVKLKSS